MATTSSRRAWWLVPAGLVLLSLVPAISGTFRLTQLGSGAQVTADNERFFAMPLPIMLHILGAVPYSLLGAFQFSSEFRRRYRGWHRGAGRVLVVLGLMAAFSGLWMTLVYPWANHDGGAVYVMRLLFGSVMAASIVVSVDAIRRRDFAAHGRWMMRAYAIGVGAGTQVFTHLPWFILADGKPGELPRAIMMGAGWMLNIVVAEWIIRSQLAREAAAGVAHRNRPGASDLRREAHHAY
jgi:uncharacterized membrane protein